MMRLTRLDYARRRAALFEERQSWIEHWRDISENASPRTGRFLADERNKGTKKHNLIYDNTATLAVRTAAAGLMAGNSSPARPWVRITTTDPDLAEFDAVKQWLGKCNKIMRAIFAKSNLYRMMHTMYEEIIPYGTAAGIIMPNTEHVSWGSPLTIGEYAIATDDLGRPDTMYREFDMTVRTAVEQFGHENCSDYLQRAYERKNYDQWVTITHAIQPRPMSRRDAKSKLAIDMLWASCYFESKGSDNEKLLREGGFKRFRVAAPRWQVSGGDIYGNSPIMLALGDIKQLQHQQYRKLQAIDQMSAPAAQVPAALKGQDVDLLPDGITYVEPGQEIRNALSINIDLQSLLMDIQDVRERIRSALYSDLFLMLINDNRSNTSATEIAMRHEEKLLLLGPVLENLNSEMLSEVVDMVFDDMLEAGIMPIPPEELQGQELKIEFVSVLAQAQRAVGLTSIERVLGVVGSIAAATGSQGVWDKIDIDQVIDRYSDDAGVDPSLIVGDEKVALIRKQRADEQAQMQQMQMMQQAAQAAKSLGGIKTDSPNALTDALSGLTGYSGGGL